VLSFVYVGIYWNNHHHMFQLAEAVDGAVLWTNLHLLFWLSLLPPPPAGWARTISRAGRPCCKAPICWRARSLSRSC